MDGEIFVTYALPVIAAALTAIAGYVGTQVKKLYEKYVNNDADYIIRKQGV